MRLEGCRCCSVAVLPSMCDVQSSHVCLSVSLSLSHRHTNKHRHMYIHAFVQAHIHTYWHALMHAHTYMCTYTSPLHLRVSLQFPCYSLVLLYPLQTLPLSQWWQDVFTPANYAPGQTPHLWGLAQITKWLKPSLLCLSEGP